jgi:HEAT repeat protein
MPVLLAALKDKDPWLRYHAAQVIGEMGKEARSALPQLIAALKEQDEQLSGILIDALAQMGKDAAPAIPALVDIVRDSGDSWVRARAAQALVPFGRDAKDAVPGLLDMLKNSRRNRGAAAVALAKIATPAEALPALIEAFAEPSREPHREEYDIAQALHQLGPEAAGPVAELLRHKRPEVRIRAIKALVGYGRKVPSILPFLMGAIDDQDEDVALSAAEAVWNLDRRTEVLPCFTRGLKAKTATNRVRAARGLMSMDAEAKAAVPDLITACKDRDPWVRREALAALSQLDREAARKLVEAEADGM